MTETQSVKQDEGLNKENSIYEIWRLNNMAHPNIPAIEYFGNTGIPNHQSNKRNCLSCLW
jgi:hypothetical protein